MKISIITVTKNNKAGLIRAIESVRSQSYKNIEYIIVDGGSTDGTLEAIKNLQFTINNLRLVSEADTGIYDAINKGIKLATGDVIGLLHSDDFYLDEFVLEKYSEAFAQSAERQAQSVVDAVYSDLVYIKGKKPEVRSKNGNSEIIEHSALKIEHSIIRYWKAGYASSLGSARDDKLRLTNWLENGWMPPHPTLFIRREIFEKYGLYRTDMKIAADYEMVLRLFYKYKITTSYLPLTTYCMTIGGASNKSLKNIFIKSSEDYTAMKMHGIKFPLKTLFMKNIRKLPQFFV
jgi:glycosyltransferase